MNWGVDNFCIMEYIYLQSISLCKAVGSVSGRLE
jgi:hypothetical protein